MYTLIERYYNDILFIKSIISVLPDANFNIFAYFIFYLFI